MPILHEKTSSLDKNKKSGHYKLEALCPVLPRLPARLCAPWPQYRLDNRLDVSQGEGTSLIDPKSVTTNTIAHYFKFEEIFCGRHIEAVDACHYSYSGHVIAFNPEGVANMRPNPKTTNVHRDTVCFTESRCCIATFSGSCRKCSMAK